MPIMPDAAPNCDSGTSNHSPGDITADVVEQSILQQAEAVAAAQADDSASIAEHDAALREAPLDATDLASPPTPDDELPPPAYGETYGEIRNEKAGLSTSALVSDDGRVNIRINQLNRRLSQVFIPALRQEQLDSQETLPPPPPYIPPSLGGKPGLPPPPPLNVVIQVVGSRGDVQPFVALGKVLKETYGHRVRLATHPNFRSFVLENGLEFFSIGGDPSRLMAFMVKNPGLMPGFRSIASGDIGERRKDVAEYIYGCWLSCYKTGDGMSQPPEEVKDDSSDSSSQPGSARPFIADCIIANPPSFAHIHCAEKLGIPLHIMFTMPYSPTQSFPHPLANIQSSNADPQLTNYLSYAMIDLLSWQALGDIVNRFRSRCLGLDPVSVIWGPGMLQRLKIPHTYCWSPALIPKPKDWGGHISIAGFYLLNLAADYTSSSELQAFLDAGPPPVYIGFGSIVLDDPNAMTELIFQAAKKSDQRVLLSKGWGGMGADELSVPNNVFMLGNVPHDWLFKHVSCVVHHGGAGTTAAGITAGKPTVVVPFFGDQPFWGAMVARAGAGPDPIPHKQLTAEKLADAINFCLKPESVERAQELAAKIAEERGNDTGAQSFHQHLQVDRLRCSLVPSRAATWRIKRTQIRLSAFAACTLANAKLLDFHDLKLFRPQEHYTDEGPVEPISGGFMAVAGSVGSMLMGVADIPSGAAKTWLPSLSDQSSAWKASKGSPSEESSLKSDQRSMTSSTADRVKPSYTHSSKGVGRIVKAIVKGPMDISVSMTQGMHNVPKLLGDDTVRPQERISDFKSGAKAAGREFGLGFYDGITGLVMQPWNGARKEGAVGFVKGLGRGLGGFIAKPTAGVVAIPGYMMKGVHREMNRLYGGNVQNYVIASRVAQGYEEWMQSSEQERKDVIASWETVQKYVKGKHSPDDMMQDMLAAQQNQSQSVKPTLSTQTGSLDHPPPTDEVDAAAELSRQVGGAQSDALTDATIPDDAAYIQHRHKREEADREIAQEDTFRQATMDSKKETQRHAREKLEYNQQLEQALAQSLQEHRNDPIQLGISSASAASTSRQPVMDSGPVSGTTRQDFEATQKGEKTAEEKSEEAIVLEYIKKQSLLEQQHRSNKAEGPAEAGDDVDDEELNRVLKLSMQDQ